MGVYIGQASIDERGRAVGGQAGNQSGTELNTRAFYNKPWDLGLIRFKDGGRARECASAVRGAVGNMLIGYDQGERNTILEAARAASWNLAAISRACECDCSSLAGVCGIVAGAPESSIYQYGNLCYTGNIIERFQATGMVEVFGSSYAGNAANLQNGDILVSSTHAAVVASGAREPNGSGGVSTGGSAGGSDIDALAQAVISGRYGNGDDRRAALGDKYDAVQARVNELLTGTVNAPGTSTGSARIIGGTYKVIAGAGLNVRSAPSTSSMIVAAYGFGDVIYEVGADIMEADGFYWAHYVGGSGNTRYVALGTADGSEKYLAKV